ncbi:MAG: potassium-transporting ATPase subunit B, partial [Acidimicrobiales bacterium]
MTVIAPSESSTPPPPPPAPRGVAQARSLFDLEILSQAIVDSFKKLDPRIQIRNPVMFVVLIGTIVTLLEAISHPSVFSWSITVWLFLTVLFANFAEAMAEGRGKAQAETLRRMRSETEARRLRPDGTEERVAASALVQGDLVVC